MEIGRMKCPHCGKEIENVVVVKSAPQAPMSDKIIEYPRFRFTDGVIPFQAEGTCIDCLRGDCERARKGIPHT